MIFTVPRAQIAPLPESARWLHATTPIPREAEKLVDLEFMDLAAVACDLRFELWSRLACKSLLESA